MRTSPNTVALRTPRTHLPAAATAAVITVAAAANTVHVVESVAWSYSVAPTGGRLTIVAGSTTLLDLDITAAGPGQLLFDEGLWNNINPLLGEALVITLASGAGAVVGKLMAITR